MRGATSIFEKNGEVRPLGSKGSNPLKDRKVRFNLFRLLIRSLGRSVVRSAPSPPRSSFVLVIKKVGTKDYISNV